MTRPSRSLTNSRFCFCLFFFPCRQVRQEARPAIFFDTGSITMEFEIMKRKLNLVHHIKNLDDNCLAKEIYNEQIRNNWPGLTKECEEFCESLNIPNVITTEMTKGAWKNKVKQAIKEKNSQNLKDKMDKYSKLEEMRQEENANWKVTLVTWQWRKLGLISGSGLKWSAANSITRVTQNIELSSGGARHVETWIVSRTSYGAQPTASWEKENL